MHMKREINDNIHLVPLLGVKYTHKEKQIEIGIKIIMIAQHIHLQNALNSWTHFHLLLLSLIPIYVSNIRQV